MTTTRHDPNMTRWPTIGCSRGCETHAARWVDVNLGRHGYADLTAMPSSHQRRFTMSVWNTIEHPIDGGPYCPAHDVVSDTIASHGVWEPRETAAMFACLDQFPTGIVVDFGAHVGWFTLNAAMAHRHVVAVEADRDNVDRIIASARLNDVAGYVDISVNRIDADTQPLLASTHVAFAKIDTEGAEHHAVRMLWPAIEAGNVAAMLIELSPSFDTYYRDMALGITEAGFIAYAMPPKALPAHRIRSLHDLISWRLTASQLGDMVEIGDQIDVLFVKADA